MVLFSIPDIRLFWSTDPRFLNQFEDGKISPFQSFSKFPPCFKDVSFWLPEISDGDPYHENYVFEVSSVFAVSITPSRLFDAKLAISWSE